MTKSTPTEWTAVQRFLGICFECIRLKGNDVIILAQPVTIQIGITQPDETLLEVPGTSSTLFIAYGTPFDAQNNT